MKLRSLFLIIIGVLLLSMAGCTGRSSSRELTHEDSLHRRHNDTLIWMSYKTTNRDSFFTVVDSLERIGDIGPIRADYERGYICKQKNLKQLEERYFHQATTHQYSNDTEEERFYYRAVFSIVNLLQVKHDYEGALRVAIPNLPSMKASAMVRPMEIGVVLGDVGICQLKTMRYAEAQKSFEDSYRFFQLAIDRDTTYLSSTNAMIIAGNTLVFCINEKQYDMANQWIARYDTLIANHRKRFPADSAVCDRQHARLCANLARNLLAQGKKEEADKVYHEVLNTKSYQQGLVKVGEYQMEAQRYAEAVKSYAGVEDDIRTHVARPTLDIVQQYLFPKYRANAYAGYKDSALAVGLRILDALDSAIVWDKQDEAAELATIYETQEKDREIAEQKSSISQQRWKTTIIVSVLVVLALAVFIFFRHRAAVRLENEHKKLLQAYDQLEETTTVKERIESELRIARDIQMSMVPHVFPEIPGLDMYAAMIPAREVGGDLYNYLLTDNDLYFCLGDVSGKGVPASLFMAQTTRLFRTLAAQQMDPAEICTRMNAALTEDNEQGMFVTLFIGLVNLQTGHLSFCNAGHNPPVIGGDKTHGSFLRMESNAPIGLWPNLVYVGEEIDSIKGKPFFVYTDGLNEAENLQKKQFGEERLLEILRQTQYESARQVIDTLTQAVSVHRQGAEPNDDLTMLCLKIK